MRELKQPQWNGTTEAVTANTVLYSNLKQYNMSLYVEFDVTENSNDAKGITFTYCKGNLQYYTG